MEPALREDFKKDRTAPELATIFWTQLEAIEDDSLYFHPLGDSLKELREIVDRVETKQKKIQILKEKALSKLAYAKVIITYRPFLSLFLSTPSGLFALADIAVTYETVAFFIINNESIRGALLSNSSGLYTLRNIAVAHKLSLHPIIRNMTTLSLRTSYKQ